MLINVNKQNIIKYIYLYFLDTIRKLCENGLPTEQYFDLCAKYILEYDLIRRSGLLTESTEDYLKIPNNNNINHNDNNNKKTINKEEHSKNISFEEKLKLGLEVKNESLK